MAQCDKPRFAALQDVTLRQAVAVTIVR